MTHASLFSGIGGFDLAAEWMGWENIFHCEWNPFSQKVLKHHFPNSISYNDITKTDFSIHRGQVDILTGGFPCQPYSTAGLRKGKADERHLFPHMLRCIKEVKPRWIIGENVRGLVSWNGGMVFDEVCDDLEREGYEVQPFLIPAASVNAPHQRQRIWFVAYSNNNGTHTRFGEVQEKNGEVPKWNNDAEFSNSSFKINVTNSNFDNDKREIRNLNGKKIEFSQKYRKEHSSSWEFSRTNISNVTNSNCNIIQTRQIEGILAKQSKQKQTRRFSNECLQNNWINFPTKPPICGGDDGISRELDNITFSKWRNESIKAYGNAIVPQVAHQIFKAIQEFELMVNK
jgi:DNA (cytosine-5)-methyltransferase 1